MILYTLKCDSQTHFHAVITFFWRLGSLPEAGEDEGGFGGIIWRN